MTRPADNCRHTECPLPVRIFLAAERRRSRVRPAELIRTVIGGVNHDGVFGNSQVVELLEQLTDILVVFPHTVGVVVARHAALALVLWTYVREDMHPREVHPDEERFSRFYLFVYECHRRVGGLVVD